MRVFLLPSVPQPHYLPPRSGLYYITAAWLIFYVGKSQNLRQRWRTHHRRREFHSLAPFGRIHYRLLPPHQLTIWEQREIKRLCPPWNYRPNLTDWEKTRLQITIGLRMASFVSLVGVAFLSVITVPLR
ncbi:MAG: GIY-YIG nuclease family protein [Pseudanabaenaceae cyanobacterium SKYGB_i_bin29]|nr:GIY-YIG nuclease family protein [Pseudanabaenaceae cyanobacterium SKYG29]MDW8421280.1 GIY-YIG nuclease family protein [Pseudanabaenaceae cyanobacterium SKYGB_i_bin29]